MIRASEMGTDPSAEDKSVPFPLFLYLDSCPRTAPAPKFGRVCTLT
jgi:hypothetical protein